MANSTEPSGVLKVIQAKALERILDEFHKSNEADIEARGCFNFYAVARRAKQLQEKVKNV